MSRELAYGLIRSSAVLGVVAALAACSSDDGVAPADTIAGQLIRGTTAPAHTPDPDDYKKIAHCPKVAVRAGTQTHLVTERAKAGAAPKIRFQGTITKTARDCDTGTGNLKMRIGVAGRLLTGPDGGSGTVRLPVRVVALIPPLEQKEAEVLYSKLHEVAVDLPAGRPSVSWAMIDEGVDVKLDKRVKVYVGFDTQGEAKKPKR